MVFETTHKDHQKKIGMLTIPVEEKFCHFYHTTVSQKRISMVYVFKVRSISFSDTSMDINSVAWKHLYYIIPIDLPLILIIRHFVSWYTNLIILKARRRLRFLGGFWINKKKSQYDPPLRFDQKLSKGEVILRETFGYVSWKFKAFWKIFIFEKILI